MIKLNGNQPKVMEFASFEIKDASTEDELINTVLAFEEKFLKNQKGILFHCLVKNQQKTYANVLLAENEEVLINIQKSASKEQVAKDFFSVMKRDSVKMNIHSIQKNNFEIPEDFSCVEHGTFLLKSTSSLKNLNSKSDELEKGYLNNFTNSKGHFIGSLQDNKFSEIAFGQTLGKTKQICYGYLKNKIGIEFLNLLDDTSMNLDFYYVLA
ncbi:hypothetical protein [Polaribacter sp. MED152]|uniref:hypothetical protein n=1 Tax=Polaribacter sp. MED152 TaxID=313598 RepID=UPI000068CD93|nr:hypothetical protein [Polaribacter sp. MED152]EAQ41244.1 hypothetical protein MED152_00980 [Polaribacter sp. MED152]